MSIEQWVNKNVVPGIAYSQQNDTIKMVLFCSFICYHLISVGMDNEK